MIRKQKNYLRSSKKSRRTLDLSNMTNSFKDASIPTPTKWDDTFVFRPRRLSQTFYSVSSSTTDDNNNQNITLPPKRTGFLDRSLSNIFRKSIGMERDEPDHEPDENNNNMSSCSSLNYSILNSPIDDQENHVSLKNSLLCSIFDFIEIAG
jgi:hypothetical protein